MKLKIFLFLPICLAVFNCKNERSPMMFFPSKSTIIIKAEVLEIGPPVSYSWGYTEQAIACKPLIVYKGKLPDTVNVVGFELVTKMVDDRGEKPVIVEVGKEYVIFLSSAAGEFNYMKENKLYPLYSLSGTKMEQCILPFSPELEKQLLDSIR